MQKGNSDNETIKLTFAISLELMLLVSVPALASNKNLVAGTWVMLSARANEKDLFSKNPHGILIFTRDMYSLTALPIRAFLGSQRTIRQKERQWKIEPWLAMT